MEIFPSSKQVVIPESLKPMATPTCRQLLGLSYVGTTYADHPGDGYECQTGRSTVPSSSERRVFWLSRSLAKSKKKVLVPPSPSPPINPVLGFPIPPSPLLPPATIFDSRVEVSALMFSCSGSQI